MANISGELTSHTYSITNGEVKTYGNIVTINVYTATSASAGGSKIGEVPEAYRPSNLMLEPAFNSTSCFMQVGTDGSIYLVGSGQYRGVLTYAV